jgi:hypothetical protein
MIPVLRSSSDWKSVRDKIRLDFVATELLGPPEMERDGVAYWYCPFHGGGDEPTLKIVTGKAKWTCSCGLWGDAIDLVRRTRNTTFSGALQFLSRREFYTDEEEVHTESPVPSDETDESESTEVHDDSWIDSLLGDG